MMGLVLSSVVCLVVVVQWAWPGCVCSACYRDVVTLYARMWLHCMTTAMVDTTAKVGLSGTSGCSRGPLCAPEHARLADGRPLTARLAEVSPYLQAHTYQRLTIRLRIITIMSSCQYGGGPPFGAPCPGPVRTPVLVGVGTGGQNYFHFERNPCLENG